MCGQGLVVSLLSTAPQSGAKVRILIFLMQWNAQTLCVLKKGVGGSHDDLNIQANVGPALMVHHVIPMQCVVHVTNRSATLGRHQACAEVLCPLP